jgi:hypothetical protein
MLQDIEKQVRDVAIFTVFAALRAYISTLNPFFAMNSHPRAVEIVAFVAMRAFFAANNEDDATSNMLGVAENAYFAT